MHVENLTNFQAVAFVVGLISVFILIYRLIPAPKDQVQEPPRKYTPEEIHAYDKQIPKYFLVAILALIIGGLHTVIKNIPGFYQWLWVAGYGGHLFRDLANSHIVIVGGGTILLTGFTWYMLPRLTNRPLFSTTLATASFWMTTIGLYGFYLSWVVLGIVEGKMVANGWDYLLARQALGDYHVLPTAITAGIMGMGYWTYVLNTVLTVVAARKIQPKPQGYLIKFSVISAIGLFIGTVQGVIQVLPLEADWIRLAGQFGEYIDPISHAHVNLVTGVTMSLAAFLIYFSVQMGGGLISKRNANLIFWVLAPGSLLFYLSFLFLGLILGGSVNGYGGIQNAQLVAIARQARVPLLAFTGTWVLTGFWLYFITMWRHLGLRQIVQEVKAGSPKAFWLLSSLALVIGTFQGLLQIIPVTARIIDLPSEIPNIHAQLNMIGGVLLALMGLVVLMVPKLVGQRMDQKLTRYGLYGVAGGIFSYYTLTVITGLIRYGYLSQGLTDGQTAAHLSWFIPATLMLTSLPMFLGYLAFGAALWRATVAYRAEWGYSLTHIGERFNNYDFQYRYPIWYYLMGELISAGSGFPGLGWVLSGRAFPGILMMLFGPTIAWMLLPVLMDPYLDGILRYIGFPAIMIYLATTATLSTTILGLTLMRARRKKARAEAVHAMDAV